MTFKFKLEGEDARIRKFLRARLTYETPSVWWKCLDIAVQVAQTNNRMDTLRRLFKAVPFDYESNDPYPCEGRYRQQIWQGRERSWSIEYTSSGYEGHVLEVRGSEGKFIKGLTESREFADHLKTCGFQVWDATTPRQAFTDLQVMALGYGFRVAPIPSQAILVKTMRDREGMIRRRIVKKLVKRRRFVIPE